MSNSIEISNGTLSVDTAKYIAILERQIKEIKKKEEEIKQAILEAMESSGVVKLETDDMVITYVGATDSEKFDSKSFRKSHPDLYDDYVKITKVNAYIKIRLKDEG